MTLAIEAHGTYDWCSIVQIGERGAHSESAWRGQPRQGHRTRQSRSCILWPIVH